VLCSDIPVLREVSQGLANYVPPNEPETVALKMVALLAQENSAANRQQRMAIVDKYTWASCAAGVLAAINARVGRWRK